MNDIILTLTAREPLVISSGSAESMLHECLGYIPGNMLLGAFAHVWKRLHPGVHPDDHPDFQRLFLNSEISWGHAMPLCQKRASVPIPLSYRYDKNHGQLPLADTVQNDTDSWICNVLALGPNQSMETLWNESHPGQILKQKKINSGFMNPQSLHRLAERRVFNVHVALGKARSALEGQLYAYSALEKDTVFQSRVICHSPEARAALLALLKASRLVHVGHARSAGYGALAVEFAEEKDCAPQAVEGDTFSLFLLSQYLPAPSWLMPLDGLCRELAAMTGVMPELERGFSALQEIQSYNSLWNRPRDSRLALAMGSALRLLFPRPVSLPGAFSLGADQAEGYGRIICNPDFLLHPLPRILPTSPQQVTTQAAPTSFNADSEGILRILRERSSQRLLLDKVSLWLNDERWRKFLDSASRLSRPSASQRNNLRDMNLNTFTEMLKKSPGIQWQEAVAFCPFSGRRDHLAEIVKKLLNPEDFKRAWPLDMTLPPLAAPNPDEKGVLFQKAHKLFIHELVSTWGKMSNMTEKE